MPTPTTRLRAVLQDPGSNLNVWGQLLNDQAISLLDEAIAGVERITLTGNVTLTSANYASDQSRNAALIFQGSPAAHCMVTIPSVEKVYVVSNTTGKSVTLSAGGAAVTLAAGDRAVVWCDGTDCGLGSISATTVNGLIANAQLAGANLPDQPGNAGKFLQTDGAVPTWAAVPNPDVGGGADATITTSVTLSASASVVQSVDMATAAQSVRLPDATTLSKGGRKFVFLGVGNRTFGVRDATGTLLTVVPAGAAAELHLRDNATAAGSWGVTGRGLEPALTLVDHTAPTTIMNAIEVAVRLTDSLSVHFGGISTGFGALAVDNATGQTGAWTAVEASGGQQFTIAHAFRVSDTQAIVFWTQTNHKAAVLTVDPATRAITVGNASSVAPASNNFLGYVTFSGRPVLAQLTPTLYLAVHGVSGSTAPGATAISVSGSTVTIGSPAALSTTVQAHLACYRINDTQALAIYLDDSGTAGSPYSIRAAVLSVTGTTISVGTSAGINDVVASAVLPTCQLSATKYVVGWYDAANTRPRAAAITVSGTTVAFGTPASFDIGSTTTVTDAYANANRFQPNLYRISDTAALFTYGHTSAPSRHVVLSESGGNLTAGGILYSLWTQESGGNFPQTPGGFLAFSNATGEMAVFGVTINGSALAVTGTTAPPWATLQASASWRFGLSGGVCGITTFGTDTGRVNGFNLFRFRANGAPQYVGFLSLNDFNIGSNLVPVEISSNKVAVISGSGMTQPAATGNNVRLQIVEFAQ